MPGLQKIPKELILGAIAKLGPCQPIDVRKELKQGDTFLIGAMLSELVADGTLAISKTRRGGSPFYYDRKVPESLEKISQYLNEKDRRTCAMLKEQKVMREDAQEPLVRVGLQSIHDFAQRVAVGDAGSEVIYWRYFLVSEPEALRIIKGGKEEKRSVKKEEDTPKEEKQKSEESKQEQLKTEPAKEDKEIKDKEIKMSSPALEKKKRVSKTKTASATSASSVQQSAQDWLIHDTLYEKVQIFAVSQKGILTHQQSIRPNAELTCMMTTEGPYGRISVLVYALNKKKFAEKEITQALLQARGHGVPLLVLSVEDIPAKIMKSFENTLNVYFKSF